MDRADDGSSADVTIGRSSPEEDRKRKAVAATAESPVVGGSSSSLDTVVGPGMEKKKKERFGALKSSFRKEGGIFHIKKRNPKVADVDSPLEAEVEQKDKEKEKSKGWADWIV